MTNFNTLNEHVLVKNLEFGEKVSRGGIIITDDDGSARGIHPRWGQVWKVGAGVKELVAGDWILVEHGRWSRTTKVEDENGDTIKINRVDYPTGILVISDKKSDDVYMASSKKSDDGRAGALKTK